MGKILLWLAIILGVLLILRLINSKKITRRNAKTAAPQAESMVRCAQCGIYLPRSEADERAGAFFCRDQRCTPAR